jgi:uncharacterized protein (TIGR03435 family)
MKISLLAALAFLSSAIWAQSPAPILSFEAASIHASDPGLPVANFHTSPGVFTVRNVTLRSCIEWAYGIKPLQLSGPVWINDERFDITARAEDGTADDDRLRLMLRTLLADRFGLKIHREKKEQQVYALTLAKNGPKFHEPGTKDASKFLESTTAGPSGFSEDKTGAMGERVSINEIADKISQLLDRIVTDRTGLTGRYDFRIDLSPYMNAVAADGNNGPRSDVMSVLFSGFNDQLGLKLEPGKETVDLVVIDSVNRTPTEN